MPYQPLCHVPTAASLLHRFLLTSLLGLSIVSGNQAFADAKIDRPNILFIAVDDLRPELGCYGKQHIHSPNIDRLAQSGMLFEQAYCMVPTCGASRASLMSGIRPNRNRFVNYLAWAEKEVPGKTTLNTHFKQNGYHTVSLGKIFHHLTDSATGWSEPAWSSWTRAGYQRPENQALHAKRSKELGARGRGPAYESAEVPDNAYGDGVLAERAVADLQRLSQQATPFFLAVGFYKPHLPFVAPKKYWDLYDPKTIHLPENYYRPRGVPREAIHGSGELRAYANVAREGNVSEELALNLIRGYQACVSYTDAQVGKLLNELDRLGLADNTIVILWGDHGWNLGEHAMWCKHCCFETSMHAPLIVRVPGIQAGQRTSALIEFIDVYPSLCELASLPLPDHLEGKSFVPLLSDPKLKWKTAALGRYKQGDTIRTAKFRFTEFTDEANQPLARMLYDHTTDPNENLNLSEKEKFKTTTTRLTNELHQRIGSSP